MSDETDREIARLRDVIRTQAYRIELLTEERDELLRICADLGDAGEPQLGEGRRDA